MKKQGRRKKRERKKKGIIGRLKNQKIENEEREGRERIVNNKRKG